MKKYFLLSFLLSNVYSYVQAQFAYGFEAGIGGASMHFVPSEGFTNSTQKTVLSWKAGQVDDVRMNDHIYFQTGIFLEQKGQQRRYSFYSSDTLNASADQTLRLLYATVPLGLVFKSGIVGSNRFFFGIGASFSYLLVGSNKYSNTGRFGDSTYSSSGNDRISNGNPIKAFEVGVDLNAGYELSKGLFFRVYYNASVTDIGIGSETDKNRIWGASAGYLFGKAKAVKRDTDELIDKGTD